MVHNKDEINRIDKLSDNSHSSIDKITDNIVYPEFTVDDDGIPYCKTQSDYEKIKSMNLKERFPNEFEKVLTCLRCDHYHHDDCFFPKPEIEKIENDRQNTRIRCALCGMKIHRIFSIMMSLFYKERYSVNIPVMCCTCYATLENGTFIKNTKRRMILFGISFATSIYFLLTYFMTIFLFNYLGILLFIIPFSFWGYISIRDAKNLYYLYKGRKYYNTIMGAQSAELEKTRRDEFLDDDDKKKPDEGAFYSPGYD